MNKYILLLSSVLLSACTQVSTIGTTEQPKTIYINDQQQRINTIECQDFDDWYLDGFRVGKTYPSYKQKLLNYRINFCEQKITEQQKQFFMQNWLKGFEVGLKPNYKGK